MHILQGDLVTFIHVLLPISCKNKAEHLNTRLVFAKFKFFMNLISIPVTVRGDTELIQINRVVFSWKTLFRGSTTPYFTETRTFFRKPNIKAYGY